MRRILALGGLLLAGWSPLTAEHPEVAEGNRRLEAGDAEGALRSYERAEKQLGPRPEIDYDRGGALHRLGRFAEAREAYEKALETPRGAYNLGNTLARLDDTDGAIRAFRRALALDPDDEDARYNLEVMLRRRSEARRGPPPEEQSPPPTADGGTPDGGTEDGGRDGGAAPGDAERDGGPAARRDLAGEDGGHRDGGETEEARAERKERQGASGRGASRPSELSRHEAERLLDSMREREKNMPMRPVEERRGRRPDVAKDW